jgi:hypothetical protein
VRAPGHKGTHREHPGLALCLICGAQYALEDEQGGLRMCGQCSNAVPANRSGLVSEARDIAKRVLGFEPGALFGVEMNAVMLARAVLALTEPGPDGVRP